MADGTDIRYMRRALDLAARGRGSTSPNPMVGAVLVLDGRVVGEGFHRAAGRDHAEVEAISAAGDEARGATLYVSLEPCCHHGKTSPCTDAIFEAGIAKVVYAVDDPNPQVSGRGAAILGENGVEVIGGVLPEESEHLNEAFFFYHLHGRPFVVLKSAQTLDGRIATRTGDSKWISGPAALDFAHHLRADADAVIVGMETVRADDPSLTVRHVEGIDPYRIVVSASLDFPQPCRLLDDNGDGRTIIATTAEATTAPAATNLEHPPTIWALKCDEAGRVDLESLLQKAGGFGLRSILVEGGAALATSFLRAGLIDRYVQITAPKIIGSGISAIGDLGILTLDEGVEFDNFRFENLGHDSVFIGDVKRRA